MSTKDNELDLLDIADESQVLSDLLSVIASAITQASGGINEIESCISIAWRISRSINENLLKLTRTAQAKSARSYKHNLAINSQNRIRIQREACGLTTAELARLLDLDEEIIIQWESGEYEPTISMLIPLANVLGCDPLSLLSGENAVTQNPMPAKEETIGSRIKSARKKLGLTEADLARMVNTYSDPINDWECDICEVPADQIVPLASALNCDLMWLLTGKPTTEGTCA